jgi:hypothetical protein
MEWKIATTDAQGLTKIPKRWLHIHYYEALNILFRFENSLRIFVYAVLKNEFKDRWQDCSFSVSGADPQSIKNAAARRISQAETFGYLGFDIRAPLMHLTSGELIELLTSDAYWPKFRAHFRGNKEIIKNKLLEIGSIRNSLAHFRPIRADDIELVKQNSRHTLLGVEACLSNVFFQSLRVPTNTTADWYASISTLGTSQISTTPFYSSDESWINLQLSFASPVLSQRKYGESYFEYTVGKINSPNILLQHNNLRTHVTYVSETALYPSLTKEFVLKVSKQLNFVFRKDQLATAHSAIAADFAAVLRRVAEECDLLAQDSLARGSIVETTTASAYFMKPKVKDEPGRWQYNYNEVLQPYQSQHPDEYWGQHIATIDVVAGLERYPWMPATVSQDEDLFE